MRSLPCCCPPASPSSSARARRCPRPRRGDVAVVDVLPGTRGYADLRRDSELVDVGGGQIRVASPWTCCASNAPATTACRQAPLEAVLEHRRRWPDGPRPPRDYSDEEAAEAIEAWLTRH